MTKALVILWPLTAVALVAVGLGLIHPPLAPLGVGALMLADYIHARRGKRKA